MSKGVPEKTVQTRSRRVRSARNTPASDYQREIDRLEQRLEVLIEISSDFYWELDTQHRLTVVRGPDIEKAGFDTEQLIGKCHWELTSVAPISADGRWDGLIEALNERVPFADFVYSYQTLKGEQRYLSISGKPIFDDAGRFSGYRGISKDITARVQIERRIAIEQAVVRILTDADDISSAVRRVLQAVVETLGWACGAYWQKNEETQTLLCVDTWRVDDEALEPFLVKTRQLSPLAVNTGGGLVRETCATGTSQWIRNITKVPTFQRTAEAAAARLRSGFAFPIQTKTKTIGVMEFYCRDSGHRADDALLRGTVQLGNSIGQFISRKRTEEEMTTLQMAIDLSPDMIHLLDAQSLRYLYANKTACRISGYTQEEYLKLTAPDVNRMSREEHRRLFDRVIANGEKGLTMDYVAIGKSGRGSYVETTRRALQVGDKWIIASITRDISERKLAEKAMARQGRMFAALSATNEAIMHAASPERLYQEVCDAAVDGGKFLSATLLVPSLVDDNLDQAATAGTLSTNSRPAGDDQSLASSALRTLKPTIDTTVPKTSAVDSTGPNVVRSRAAIPLLRQGKGIGVLLLHANEKRAFDDEIVKLLERMTENIAFALDNFEREAERKRGQERIQYLATHDGLTGLPNRVMFNELLSLAIESARRYERKFAVLFIDLDRFKMINDTLGHQAGDVLLKEMSARLKECLRASDVVARLGGDEFVVLVQEAAESQQVTAVARKILSAVMAPVEILGQECRVTASIGIAMYPADAEDEQSLMKNADIAMYLAKEEGKNNFQFYSKEIKAQSLERMTIETHLRRALERDELHLHYQAKVDLKSGAITGVEALLRWNSPELGTVSPMQLIPVAEETGLIVPIGRWVLKTACEQNVAWQRAGLPAVCMAVNLSPRQFNDPDLLKDVAAILAETGMAPDLLQLEITESMVMHNTERAVKLLTTIKEMGVRLAIDDFGTGYSSLAQLKRFPIDTLKVDRSFIREIPKDSEDRAITEAIIAMGKSLSLTIVAEGVETQEQQAFLREHACDEMQGYYFSKPIEPAQFADLMRRHVATPTRP